MGIKVFGQISVLRQPLRFDLEVVPRTLSQLTAIPDDIGIQEIFRTLAGDQARTAAIADETRRAVEDGRKVLVLTERTDHLENIRRSLEEHNLEPFVLHGRMSKKQGANLIAAIDERPPDSPRILLAAGGLVGEGFDHPPLDTLVLAMPVSWKGTLQQYAGRLHREHAAKTDVRIIDLVDIAHPAPILTVGETPARLPGDGLPHRGTFGFISYATCVYSANETGFPGDPFLHAPPRRLSDRRELSGTAGRVDGEPGNG